MKKRGLELLSPALNAETAIQAILHGADAVYIGPPSHGARKAASNSIEDIESLVDFAHQFRAKVYATVNTIIYENEINAVEKLIHDLYHAGVDALIIQDMGILRMKIPPIQLHASTQCDIRTPEKAQFLQNVGFSQLVLARELSLKEIREITEAVSIPVETFIHGALCVSYSGRCHASQALTGRSANRGECAQICRLPYSLTDCDGRFLCKDKYLLSLKDFNASHNLEDLIEAGVSSFKIEGRLKDVGYVKNITALYNLQLNEIIRKNTNLFERTSFGKVNIKFQPQADKSFNRGFTNYFLTDRKPSKISSLLSPKSRGEEIRDITKLNNGDGISFYDAKGNYQGVNINRIEGSKIIPARKVAIPDTGPIFRTYDVKWEKMLSNETAQRKISLEIRLSENSIFAEDERGVRVILPLDLPWEQAVKPLDYSSIFAKLGNTPYILSDFQNNIREERFYRISELTQIRRNLLEWLDKANRASYPYDYRRKEELSAKFPYTHLDYRDNVSNSLALEFYRSHGVESIENASEVSHQLKEGNIVMTTRHCVLRELGLCKREKGKSHNLRFPLYLNYDRGRFKLDFDCKNCEMKVMLD
ncbi:MAG: U32 family peptidase [Muribaculaceae bacterium]|nr:U32 family peptidase [Muribaculaceae bacterium]